MFDLFFTVLTLSPVVITSGGAGPRYKGALRSALAKVGFCPPSAGPSASLPVSPLPKLMSGIVPDLLRSGTG